MFILNFVAVLWVASFYRVGNVIGDSVVHNAIMIVVNYVWRFNRSYEIDGYFSKLFVRNTMLAVYAVKVIYNYFTSRVADNELCLLAFITTVACLFMTKFISIKRRNGVDVDGNERRGWNIVFNV